MRPSYNTRLEPPTSEAVSHCGPIYQRVKYYALLFYLKLSRDDNGRFFFHQSDFYKNRKKTFVTAEGKTVCFHFQVVM